MGIFVQDVSYVYYNFAVHHFEDEFDVGMTLSCLSFHAIAIFKGR